MQDSDSTVDDSTADEQEQTPSGSGQPSEVDQADGGPGSHSDDDTGGAENDVASGGVPEADEG